MQKLARENNEYFQCFFQFETLKKFETFFFGDLNSGVLLKRASMQLSPCYSFFFFLPSSDVYLRKPVLIGMNEREYLGNFSSTTLSVTNSNSIVETRIVENMF
jgi:hypothetical protein